MEFNKMPENHRRSKNYAPSIWTPEHIRSFKSPYSYETHGNRLEELKRDVQSILASTKEKSDVEIMKLIDTIQQLGVSYHFEMEIKDALDVVYQNINNIETYLSIVALKFRILRQSGYSISTDVFNKFIGESGMFLENLSKDIKGLINLHEASYLGMEGEDVLVEAMKFSKKHLTLSMEKAQCTYVTEQIRESLTVPIHWRMPRAEIRGFIDSYGSSESMIIELLEFAKLDFNLIQSVYLNELQELANWWEELNFKGRLPFARDRLTENYFYAVGSVPDLQFSRCRMNVAKYATLTTILDDICDTYGLFHELQQLTHVIDRWDTKAMEEELPEYMRIWCSAMLDHVDETVKDGFNDLGLDIRTYIQAQWKTLTKVYLVEAKWIYTKKIPSFNEYVKNGWVSIAIPMSLAYVYFGLIRDAELTIDLKMEYFELWYQSDLVRLPCLIARLLDDLLSSKREMEIGEMANAIKCYMIQEGASEEQAIGHIWSMINDSWQKINKLLFQNPFPFPTRIMNITLDQAQCVVRLYKYVDFFGDQSTDNKNIATSTFFHPI